jgi:hypothetical protein
MQTLTVIVVVALAYVCTGCNGPRESPGPSQPLAPSPAAPVPSPPAPPPLGPGGLVLFTDPASGFSTSDVYDAQEQIVRFTADTLIWAADGRHFPEWLPEGNFIGYHHRAEWFFQIRFGTKDGRRGAYLTPIGRATVSDLWVNEKGILEIAQTDVPVPGT